MKVETIVEALQKSPRMPVEGLEGKVLKVFPRRTGTGEHGEWSVQNISIRDDSGSTEIAMWNREDVAHLNGKTVRLLSFAGDKGVIGLKVKEKDGKKSIEAAKSTNIEVLDGSLPEGMKSAHGDKHPTSANTARVSRISPKDRFHQYERLFLNCLSATQRITKIAEKELGLLISDSQFQAITSSLFIKADRDGLVEEMDTAPIKEQEEQPEDPDQLP